MVKNIRLINRNMTRIAGYFYSFDEETDSMVQKTDDGTLAFSYPLDTPIPNEVRSLEYDGESFWTMERINDGDPDAGFRIRRWVIQNFVMVLQNTFNFSTNAVDIFESSAFTIQKYEGTLTSGAIENTTTFNVSFDPSIFALLTPGTKMFIGPSSKAGFVGQQESVTVNSTTSPGNLVEVTSQLNNGFVSGNKIVFSKNLWVFNQHYLQENSVGALYKISSLDGAVLSRTKGGAFKDINSTGFVEIDSFTGSLAVHNKPFLIFIRTNSLLFIDVTDSNLTTELSAVQNNLNVATTEVFNVFDLAIEGNTLYRLQEKFNINGNESTDAFNYQLATFRPFPTAIALVAVEAIVPADSGASTSIITATVTDQYLLPFVTSPAATITFSTSGGGTGSGVSPAGPTSLDSNGQATTTYTTGDTAGLVTISAQVDL